MLALASCAKEPPAAALTTPAPVAALDTARPAVREQLVADLALARSPSDGKGRAWIEPQDGRPLAVEAGASGAWRIVFEAGEPGVARGGAVFLQASPFWGWSTPQVETPDAPGFTRVETSAQGVELRARTADRGLLAVKIEGRALARGERIAFTTAPVRAALERSPTRS
ncbi:MAG TPA: hypothetical protein VM509_09070, partial [Planctomycetota bacterium]|nr:hypothetical protein [Planctomycetota bacterium]